jgi:hypothetical protein
VELGKEARRILKELNDAKLAGQDYPVWGLVELANKCAAGQVGEQDTSWISSVMR